MSVPFERTPQEELINVAEERGDILAGDDGYYVYWPTGNGALSAWQLHCLGDYLDTKNAAWDAQVHRDPAVGTPCEPPDTAATLLADLEGVVTAKTVRFLLRRIEKYLKVLQRKVVEGTPKT